eukprot:333258_1
MSESIKWKRIATILENYLFFSITDRAQEKSNLVKWFRKYCEDNKGKVDYSYFQTQLCKAYYSDDDKSFMFYSILYDKLNYSLDKRHQFYHILLHHHMKLSDFNPENTA